MATCPGETEIVFSTCGEASFDTVLEVRRGSCRGRAEGCSDDGPAGSCTNRSGSRLGGALRGEGLWFVLVDGYLANDGGSYVLDVAY